MSKQHHGLQTSTGVTDPPAVTRWDTHPQDASVAIVGGSLVGPAAELFLRRRGLRNVVTYEALPAARSQSGGVMGLRQDTIDLLAELGVDIPAIEAIADRNVYAYDLTGDGPVQRNVSAFPGVVTSWDALHTQLRQLVDVRTNHRLAAMDEVDGRWRLRFHNRPDAFADVVLFADGRHSTGRALLDPGRPLRYNGYVVWRGLAAPPAPLPRGFERYYDIRHGRLFSITAPLRQSGRCYWELSHNLPEQVYTDIAGAGPTERAFILPQHIDKSARDIIRDAARHLPDTFAALIEQSEVAGIPVNDATMPDRAVFTGNGGAVAVLLGDALLPVRLQVGAGLNQGLRQAAEVADALTAQDRDARLRGWQQHTLDRLAPWVEQGRSRAHRNNLGNYEPVRPGRTTAPHDGQWSEPRWVTA
jgi:2,6-dihydroxypyridine 3-monooxygenase